MPMYDFLKDQGSFIAGLLALCAGIAAYVAGNMQAKSTLKAAERQVSAVNEQTEAVKRQNTELKRAARRQLAREGLIAARLLSAVVKRIQEDVIRLIEDSSTLDAVLALNADLQKRRKSIHKPSIDVVWDRVGLLRPEVIEYYLALDSAIEHYWATPSAGGLDAAELQRLSAVAKFLREALDDASGRAHAVLAETEEPHPTGQV